MKVIINISTDNIHIEVDQGAGLKKISLPDQNTLIDDLPEEHLLSDNKKPTIQANNPNPDEAVIKSKVKKSRKNTSSNHPLANKPAKTGVKKCPVCKNEFKPRGNAQVFCSDDCKKKAR